MTLRKFLIAPLFVAFWASLLVGVALTVFAGWLQDVGHRHGWGDWT